MIKSYLHLQYVMLNRKLKEMGFTPIVAYLLMAGLFLVASALLFHRIDYAPYIYLILPLFLLSHLSDRQRNDFLKTIFFECQYKTIRLVENVLIALPFALFLCWEQCFWVMVLLMAIAVLLSLVNVRRIPSFVLPTPFSKHPFEFSVGFRNAFYLFLVAYFLTVMAIVHDNFNLGAVAFGLVFVVICTFYFRADERYYVWIFSLSPSQFLRYKIEKAFVYALLLCAPILLTLSVFYLESSWVLWLGFLLGCAFLGMIIYAKYATFPRDTGIGEMVPFAVSVASPPMLIILIFYFRNKAIQKLNTVLK